MATDVADVMTAITKALSTIPGLRTADYVPGQVTPPQAIVTVPPVDYDTGFGRTASELVITVTILTSTTMDQAGQHLLAGYLLLAGEQSVKAAIEQYVNPETGKPDRTLGGVVDDCRVSRFSPIGIEAVGELGYYGGEFTIPVIVR